MENSFFDSNCISPGTVFMQELNEQLKFFVQQKINTDRRWKSTRVILSGPEVPGEGEHKIAEFIRSQKSQPNANPNTT
jgi:5'-3' exoribonuclease 1